MQRVEDSGSTSWLVPSNPMPPDTDDADLGVDCLSTCGATTRHIY
jgi:hypothetical protein